MLLRLLKKSLEIDWTESIRFMFWSSPDRFHLIYIFGVGVFVQYIRKSCPKDEYHNHPWAGLAILSGSYLEQIFGMPWGMLIKDRVKWIPAKRFHRIDLDGKPVRELFFHGPVINKPEHGKYMQWGLTILETFRTKKN